MDFLRRHSESCIIMGQQDCRESYLRRNCYMVDHAEYLIAVSDNAGGLGPLRIVAYAKKKKRKIIFIHPDTAKLVKES